MTSATAPPLSSSAIGLRSTAAVLGSRFVPTAQLEIQSTPETLESFGFAGAWVSDDPAAMALQAATRCLDQAKVAPAEIGALLWVSALAPSHQHPSEAPGEHGILAEFCYRASWLQEVLGLERATVSAVAQQGCSGMFSALRQARALLLAEPDLSHVLCVGVDVFPAQATREVLYNVISDAACACLVSRDSLPYQWLAFHQISKGYYWDIPTRQSEIIAAYFPTATLTIRQALQRAQLAPTDIDLVIPTGVNQTSWPLLLRLCGIPEDRLFQPSERFGHTVAADSFLMLEQAGASGALRPGQRLLLFAYGFGSSWSALFLETTDLLPHV